jgi:hypothetical protein
MNVEFFGIRKLSESVRGAYLDVPALKDTLVGPYVRIAGWFGAESASLGQIKLFCRDELIGLSDLGVRDDVRLAGAVAENVVAYGFDSIIDLSSAVGTNTIFAVAVDQGVDVFLFELNLTISTKDLGKADAIQPIFVTSIGRSGSTLIMKTLSKMQHVAIFDRYPYEAAISLGTTVASKAFLKELFQRIETLAPYGANPHDMIRTLNSNYVATVHNINDTVRNLYSRSGSDVGFFAEKCNPTDLEKLLAFFGTAKYIFLTRDPRDILASKIAFRQKRADPIFGLEGDNKDPYGLDGLKEDCTMFLRAVQAIPTKDLLILRFEDFAIDLNATIAKLSLFLGAVPAEDVLSALEIDGNEAMHKSSPDGRAIGRWKAELPQSFVEQINIGCASYINRFAYT